MEAADLAQQAKEWELVIRLVEIAFAALDQVPTLPCEHQMDGINPASGLAMTAY